MSYLYNNVPIIPGAYIVNGNTSSTNEIYQIPIFSSVLDLSKMGFENSDDVYYVLPGYKINIYVNENFTGNSTTMDNTNGTKIMYKTTNYVNQGFSIKMYYKNVEILEKYTYAKYNSNTGTPTTNSTLTLTNGSYKSLNLSLFPGAYIFNTTAIGGIPIFFSISDFNTFLGNTSDKEDCVLVMPGYQLILYFNTEFGGNYVQIDNTTGSTIIVGQSSTFVDGWDNNNITSCKLFFNGNIVEQTNIVSA